MTKRLRKAEKVRLVAVDTSGTVQLWPPSWPPEALVTHLRKLGAVGKPVYDILSGAPGPWWPEGAPPITGVTKDEKTGHFQIVSVPGETRFIRRLRAAEREHKAGWAALRRRDRRILSVENRVRALRLKPEKTEMILTILRSERLLHSAGQLKPLVQRRAPRSRKEEDHSALRWLPAQSVALVSCLSQHAGIPGHGGRPLVVRASVCAQVARILALASGQRITGPMVRDRAMRALGDK